MIKKYTSYSGERDFGRDCYYRYDTILKEGEVILSGPNNIDIIGLDRKIARKINALLFCDDSGEKYEDQSGSNCHITANYIAGIDNEIGNLEEEGLLDWDCNVLSSMLEANSEDFKSIHAAIEKKGYPLLCRICKTSGGESNHSIIVLGELGDGSIVGFEQSGWGGEWGFIEVTKTISDYSGRRVICTKIEE